MILITSHTNADFDSLACMVAARRLYPKALCCFSGAAEVQVRRYVEAHAESLPPFVPLKNLDFGEVERLVCVDVGDRARLGPLAALPDRTPPVPVDLYDHHPGMCDLAGERQVIEETGACISILVKELEERRILPAPFEATLFLLGIYEDTGFLTFPTTRPEDFEAVLTCLRWGGDLVQVPRVLHRGLTETQMKLLTELMGTLESVPVGGIRVHLASLSSVEYIPDLSILMHEILNLEDLDVLFLLAYLENRVHIIGRSRNPLVDASRVLDVFGGGGHPSAASATLKGKTLEEARRLLLLEITSSHPVGLKASDLYLSEFRRVDGSSSVQEAFRDMNRFRVNALPVFQGPRLKGVVTRQEVDGAIQHGLSDAPVETLVVSAPPLLPPEMPAEEVRRLMLERNWRIVLFGEDLEHVRGLLSRMNLFKSLYRLDPGPLPQRGGGQPSRQEVLNRLRSALPPREVEDLQELGTLAREMGFNCLLVGGAVRDLMLPRPLKDVDFVVEGDAAALCRAWRERKGGRLKTHEAFGTAVWRRSGAGHWDFATARAEYYEAPAALPTVAHAALFQDLYRRDFTINTLALELAPDRFGEIVDLFGGMRDLKAGRIRVLHGLSFVEDPTRAFRAVRFAVSLGFALPPETAALIHSALSQGVFRNLSAKRVLAELEQILEGAYAVEGLRALEAQGLLGVVWPSLKVTPKAREGLHLLQRTLDFFEVNFPEESLDRLCLFLMVLLEPLAAEEAEDFCARYPLSRECREILGRYRALTWRAVRQIGHRSPTAGQVFQVLQAEPLEWVLYLQSKLDDPRLQARVRDYLVRDRFSAALITGNDLKSAGFRPSRAFSKALMAARMALIDGEATTREEQLAVAIKALEGEG